MRKQEAPFSLIDSNPTVLLYIKFCGDFLFIPNMNLMNDFIKKWM